MRDIYQTTIVQPQGDGTLRALAEVEISVYLPGTETLATIYQRRTGAAEGPAPEAAASGGPNPFTTGSTGAVEFWLPAGLYEIRIRDTQAPARIAARGGSGNPPAIEFNSAPMSAGSVPTSVLAADGALAVASLGPSVIRQQHQIGEVIDWWRPANTVPIPAGFEIADGRTVTDHDFGVAGSVTLPDLRNLFILGADTPDTPVNYRSTATGRNTTLPGAYAGDAIGGGQGDAGAIPGIRGGGGSHQRDLRHTHDVPAHYHGKGNLGINDPGHGHGVNDPSHAHSLGGNVLRVTNGSWFRANPGQDNPAFAYFGATTADGVDNVGAAGSAFTGISVQGAGSNVSLGGSYVGNNSGSNGDGAFNTGQGTSQAAQDIKPKYVGLLKLMKVKRS